MLSLRRIGIDTYRENVAFLRRDCTAYQADEFRVLNRIEVQASDGAGRRIRATLNIVDPGPIMAAGDLGLSNEAFRQLDLPEGAQVSIEAAAPPASHDALRGKVLGRRLSQADLYAIVADMVAGRYSKMEVAAFLAASANSLTHEEVLGLTRAMIDTGTRLDWTGRPGHMVVDKHCIGGIPGNRTTMIVVPIVAAHGLVMPKTSSRAITSPAGTADTMEVLARVDLGIEEMQDVVERENACLAWGGHVNLSPADDLFITVERPLSIDSREQMVASILSKKVAAGATHLLLDIPVGPSAKVRSGEDATRLRKLFEYISDAIGLRIEIVMTDGRQPIGRGIGPVLEARDVLAVLRNEADAPADLRQKSLELAGQLLEFDPVLRGGEGFARARDILYSGEALAKFERIVERQGRNPHPPQPGPLIWEAVSPAAGTVQAIDCLRLARIARLAGAPIAKGAGIDLLKKCGQSVRAGEPLYRVHATLGTDLAFARAHAEAGNGYRIAA